MQCDHALLEGHEQTLDQMNANVKQEGDQVIRETARRVLGSFWRALKQQDASCQTEDKAIDGLKLQLSKKAQENHNLNKALIQMKQEIEEFEQELDVERQAHKNTRQHSREKDLKLSSQDETIAQKDEELREIKSSFDQYAHKIKAQIEEMQELKN